VPDSSVIEQVKRLHIRTRQQVSDVLAGAYLSVFKGSGIEFEEVRPYVPGDEIRSIDWNVTARTGEPHIKRFVEERELTVMLLVDISGSQDFGSQNQSKREAASEFAALLAFSAIANKDKIGLMLFHDETELYIPPRKGQKHAMRIVREVLAHEHTQKKEDLSFVKRFLRFFRSATLEQGRKTDIGGALEFCRRVLSRRSVFFVISDFMDAGFLSTIQNVNRRHDVVAVRTSDKAERELFGTGLIELKDAESGRLRLVDVAHARKLLQESEEKRIASLEQGLRSSGVDLIQINTDEPVIEPLLRFLRMRERRGRR
jgi:uncharacterized protein (DUF58 family)